MEFNSVTVVRPYEQIVTQIQGAIREGQFARGARLPTERELADSFGVSRSVVREAVKVLGAMGLVESRQGSGLYVRHDTIQTVSRAFILSVAPNAESVDRLFEFRQGLESEACRLAAARRTDEQLATMTEVIALIDPADTTEDWETFGDVDVQFHRLVADASENPYLQVAIATARDMQSDVVSLFSEKAGSMQQAMTHHRQILEAIRQRDAEGAAATMAEHIGYTSHVVHPHIPEAPDPRAPRIDVAT
ncbi:MAG: FadR family transcriptional regulator [Chloroflexota bacterium]|nr:FadR family transcriptional regulator [Chloroflexia bacterium]MDQ3442885.1 FadR family transcriptional regulator [Chloroflexota bacterium]